MPAAIVPVLIGSGVAAGYGKFSLWRAALALLVALALQVGVNFANDYSDGIRGSDAAERRVGPVRLVGSGLASPERVKLAAFGCFLVACCAGLVLAAVTSWWLVLGGALARDVGPHARGPRATQAAGVMQEAGDAVGIPSDLSQKSPKTHHWRVRL